MPKKHKFGIGMSGGSTKGAYQAGVLLALEEMGVLKKVTYYNGTSVGAINSAAMTTLSAKQLVGIYTGLKKTSDVFKATWWKIWNLKGLYSLTPVLEKIKKSLKPSNPKNVEAVSCAINTEYTDYVKKYTSNRNTEFEEWFNFVAASATIPGFMEPTHGLWFDGGIQEYIPIEETARNCRKVIAIATSPLVPERKKNKFPWPIKILMYLFHSVDGAMYREIKRGDYRKACKKHRVLMIHPEKTIEMGTFEVTKEKMKELVAMGYDQTMGMKAEILAYAKG